MALSYDQQRDLQSKMSQTGQNVLEKVVIYGLEGVKFVFGFIAQMIRQVMGK